VLKELLRITVVAIAACLITAAPAHAVLTLLNQFTAFGVAGNPDGEVNVAMGNVDNTNPGDEIVTGTGNNCVGGSGMASRVKVFTQTGTQLAQFQVWATASNPTGEVHVAVGEISGPSPKEIIVGMGGSCGGPGSAGWIGVWTNTATLLHSFPPYSTAATINPTGEVYVAAGDVRTDIGAGIDEVVTGPGKGSFTCGGCGSGWVAVWTPAGISTQGTLLNNHPIWGVDNPGHELPVTVGDFSAGGAAEIGVGHGFGGSSWFSVWTANIANTMLTGIGAPFPFFGGGNVNGQLNISAGQYDGVAGDEAIGGHGEATAGTPAGNFVAIKNALTGAVIDSGFPYTIVENPTGEVHVAGLRP